jgi:putative ABC transport system permease protein
LRTAGEPLAVVPALRAAVHALGSDAAVGYANSMSALRDEQVTLVRWLTLFATVFAAVALALSAVGLYGVITFLVSRRTPELGIRMALGADRASILRLVFGSAARTVAIGLAIGTLAGLGLTRLLGAILLDAGSAPPATFALAAVIIGTTDLFAIWLPARRAARVDPLVALRQE